MVVKTTVLKELEGYFEKSGNQLLMMYGRPDSEKELMLRSFLRNKKFFYYRARQASDREQKAQIESELEARYQVTFHKHSYEEYFNRVKSGGPEKLVVVVDEFQYIAKRDSEFLDAIIKLKSRQLYPGPVLIVLCSSAVSWMEGELKDSNKKLMDSVDSWVKLENLNFLEVVRALPDYPVSESIRAYGVFGGVPGYLNRINPKHDLKYNICRYVLSRSGYMHGAAEELIAGSLRELSVYETILAQIASGNDKLNDLYQNTGFSRAKISVYLKNLASFDIIEKQVSFETGGWDNARKGVYRIKDNFVNFWFHFIYPHLSDLQIMGTEEFYDEYIAPGLDAFISRYFRDVFAEYMDILSRMGKLPLTIHKMGTWDGKDGHIDIIAQNDIRQNMVGLCCWEGEELSMKMLEDLYNSMRQAKITSEYYYLFSSKGFSDDVKNLAESDNQYILIDMNEL